MRGQISLNLKLFSGTRVHHLFRSALHTRARDGDNNYEITTDEMTALSLDSFQQIWDAPENEQWNDFIKGRVFKYTV